MRFLGINAVFHDPAAALVIDGEIVAAAEEERFSRRKHGKEPVPFSTWELPEQAARWCLESAGITPEELDGIAYSYDPSLVRDGQEGLDTAWEGLRTLYALRASAFLQTVLPGFDAEKVHHIPHHVAHAASAGLAAPPTGGRRDCAVFVADGRGEDASHLAGVYRDGRLEILARQRLPHSLGLLYEELTAHLGFRRSSDEYKVMALASSGTPRFVNDLHELIRHEGDGHIRIEPVDLHAFAKSRTPGTECSAEHADLAASVQRRMEEVLLELTGWLYERTGEPRLAMAGGVALNCVANTRIAEESPFEHVWVQPAAGDAGTALGGALHLAQEAGEEIVPMRGADLGRGWSDDELAAVLETAEVPFERPDDLGETVAAALARNELVAWFQGRSEYGPRALGRRSLLANPAYPGNLDRLNDVKGREKFRPVAPMVTAERAPEVFSRGPLPSPYMLFVHDVADEWADRIPAVVHTDGTARVQTVDAAEFPLLARLLYRFEAHTGIPVLINTSLNTAGRPMVDSPRDALECFGSAPVDLLALGPFVVRRAGVHGRR
ncbi:MAG: carbamoyltransferase [Nocardiopsaceae bacterium]|nr:carbamoyltransferase [Nocardiopsaceae bacterium]